MILPSRPIGVVSSLFYVNIINNNNNNENIYYYGWYFDQPNGSGHLLTCGLI